MHDPLRANDAGCDFIVAQGIEAGGHVRGTSGTFALLDECLKAVDVPVLAAGGIGTVKRIQPGAEIVRELADEAGWHKQ